MSVSYYYFVYDKSIKELAYMLDTHALIGGHTNNLDKENDIILIHLILRVNQNTLLYRKEDIKSYIWNLIKDRCVVDKEFPFVKKIEYYERGFDELFAYCWDQKFSVIKDERSAIPLNKLVNQNKHHNYYMSDNRFKWLLVITSLTCIIVASIWKHPEVVKANTTNDNKLGEYVYVDPRSIIHVSRKCSKLNYKGWKSKRIKIDDIYYFYKDTPIKDISFCPHCVSDEDYEKLIDSFSDQIEKRVNEITEN